MSLLFNMLSRLVYLSSFSSKEPVSFSFMTAVAICSDFWAQGNKLCHRFHCFLIYLPEAYFILKIALKTLCDNWKMSRRPEQKFLRGQYTGGMWGDAAHRCCLPAQSSSHSAVSGSAPPPRPGLQPTRLLSVDCPGKNAGARSHLLLQGIFPTQWLCPHLQCLFMAGRFFATEQPGRPSLIIREMQIRTTIRPPLTQVRMNIIKKSINNRCRRECREKGTLLHYWWECMENCVQFPQKRKNRITTWSSNPTLGHISRQNYNSKRHMHPYVHYRTVYNRQNETWKQLKYPSTDEWIKMWYMYIIEYYLVIKKNEIMPFVAAWMQLKMIILSEVSQKEKDKYMISLICVI